MGKLSLPTSRLSVPSRRMTFGSDAAAGPAPVQHSAPWKAWYKTRRWQALRLAVLERDNYTCQRTGRVLGAKHPDPDSPVVNHRRPHRGDEALFWDIDNLETVSKAVHDADIQREEQATRHHAGVWT